MMRKVLLWGVIFVLQFLMSVVNTFGQFGDPVPRYPHEVDGFVRLNDVKVYFAETDIVIPGRGLNLEFTRYYNGNAGGEESPSYLGHLWGHTYQWSLRSSTSEISIKSGWGAKFTFKRSGTNWRPDTGVRGTLTATGQGDDQIFTYTTKHGVRYKFEDQVEGSTKAFVLTEIKDPNSNKLTLHYENVATYYNRQRPRLIAVTDTVGRVLKFHYGLTVTFKNRQIHSPRPRQITKIEFGRGTAQTLTAVYQTISYGYSSSPKRQSSFTAVKYKLGEGDPRGSEVVTQYEYQLRPSSSVGIGYLKAIVFPNGGERDFASERVAGSAAVIHRDVPATVGSPGELLHKRTYYRLSGSFGGYTYRNGIMTWDLYLGPGDYISREQLWSSSSARRSYIYAFSRTASKMGYLNGYLYWALDSYRNITNSYQGRGTATEKWSYRIEYKNTDSNSNNRQVGNATKWKQVDPARSSTVYREWTADYESTYNRPIWQIDPMGHKTKFTYDTKGNLTEVRSKANTGTQPHAIDHDIVTTHVYDSYGNRTQTTVTPKANEQQVVQTVYDSTYHTYPIEVKTTITKDGSDHTIKTKSEWDVHRGLKTADIDAGGRRTEYVYWQDRKLKYTKDVAADLYTVPTYDKDGNVTQVQVRQNNYQTGTIVAQKKTEYDGMGRVKKTHSFNNNNWTTPYATTETTYDSWGDVATTKDPRGLITTYTYDNLGRVTKQTLPDGDWVETRYNPLSKITKVWTRQSGTERSPALSYTYDTLNRPSQVSYKTGESVSYTYDKADNLLTLQTNDGSTTYTYTYTHDQLNRLITRNDSLLGYKTFYEYDDGSRRTRMHIQPSAGGADLYDVNYTYDKANRLIGVKDVLAAKGASYDYFDIGALKTSTLPNGITAHRTLDTRNRLDLLTYKKNPTTVLSSLDYTYDVKSNVTQLVRNDTGAGGASKTFTFGYDGISRLTSANYGNETVSYTYDKSGNRKTQVSTVDGTTNYTIATNSNQLTRRSLVPEDTDFSTMSYTYDAEGKLTQRSEGTDSDAFTYGFGSKLKQIQKTRSGTVTQTLSYGYDGTGKRVKVTDSGGTRYFLYDGGMPLLELDTNKKITASYLYGADGVVYRRKRPAVAHWHFDEGTGTVAHDVDGQNNGTLGAGAANTQPTWNVAGGLTFDGTNDKVRVPDSDALDIVGNALTVSLRLKRTGATAGLLVKKADASNGYQLSVTATGTVQFEIRQAGTTKTVTSTTTIPLNQWKHIAARYDGSALRVFISGTIDTATTAATGALVATTEPLWIGGDTTYLNGALDNLSIYNRALSDAEITNLSNNRVGRYEYHHLNALGSNIVLTDDNQNVLARYEYEVFGAIRNQTGTSDNPRKFTGKEYDSDVRLYYYGARYYDPYIARFTQHDPAADGSNWYAYARNNPLKFIDPTGLRARGVNWREKNALKHTFGEDVGKFLIGIIDIDFDENVSSGQVPEGTLSLILLKINYNSANLTDLSIFIHEATHIWQRNTGRYRDGVDDEETDYKYYYTQLSTLNLKHEEHATAVGDWFFVNYGLQNRMIGAAGQVSFGTAYGKILPRMGFNGEMPAFGLAHWNQSVNNEVVRTNLQSLVDHHYTLLIQDLRKPLKPKLLQNIPNPAQ